MVVCVVVYLWLCICGSLCGSVCVVLCVWLCVPVWVVGQSSLHLVQRVHGGRGSPGSNQTDRKRDRQAPGDRQTVHALLISNQLIYTQPISHLLQGDLSATKRGNMSLTIKPNFCQTTLKNVEI